MIRSQSAESRMAQALDERKNQHSLRRLIPADPSFIDFCSNDYLGLARSEKLLQLAGDEWSRLREINSAQLLGSGGSRLLAGDSAYAHELEEELAGFYKAESALLFNSGYAANTALFSALPTRGDTVIYDELIHASVRDGLRMSAARSWSFQHNDLQHLEELLQKAAGTVFIAAEAVYSMDGDECPLEEIVQLSEKYGAALILDEAHSNGLYGERGEGLAVAKKLHDRIFARLLTFGKAPGCHGALVAGSRTLREYLINFARPFIYSTALPLHDLAVIRCAVKCFSEMDAERKTLFTLASYLQRKTGGKNTGAIQAIIIPGNENARRAADACRNKKLDVRAVLSPTVAAGQERLRVILHAFNREREIDELINSIVEAGLKVDLSQ
jgi:8-amino-7-oxononanoate synthase